ncbi:MAG: nitroreductase family protein [Negativicutes bacterium]|jgi:nitroreductase
MKAVLERRSIRKYTTQAVSDDQIKDLLHAAMSAPSAGNEQPWEFVVITERGVLDSIPEIHPYSQMLKEAPVAILVCGDLRRERHSGYWVQDCSAAAENLLIAAQAAGLGAVWLGVYPDDGRVAKFREKFALPKEVIPLCLVPVGVPAEIKTTENRYKEDRVHLNKW